MGTQVWRRRRCKRCHNAFTSYEAYNLSFIDVGQSSGPALPYSKARLYSDIYMSFTGDKLGNAIDIDNITLSIEHKLVKLQKHQLHRDEIVSVVASTLKSLSITATMRYLANHPPTDSDDTTKLLNSTYN